MAAKKQDAAEALFSSVARKISPTRSEAEREKEFALGLAAKLSSKLGGENARIYFVGSTARDTGLSGDKDVDLFAAFPRKNSREHIVAKTFEATREAIPSDWQLHYAEHPYLQSVVHGYKVEVIPCFQISPHEGVKSAVDRSPLHMDYLQKRLSQTQKRDVRLLKAMLKRAGIYGAEASVGGFSGLLCEYLVLNYRSLAELLGAAGKWKPPVVIDIEGAWHGREEKLLEKFAGSPIVLIDAIDRERNAAASVSIESLACFASLSQSFLKMPSEEFFFHPPMPTLPSQVQKALGARGTLLCALALPRPKKVVEDTIIPQAHKALSSLCALLSSEEFPLFDAGLVASEDKIYFVLEFSSPERPALRRFVGPPAWFEQSASAFAKRHAKALRGPFVRGDRLVAEERREVRNATEFLEGLIEKPRGVALGKDISPAWKRAKLLEGKKIVEAMAPEELSQLYSFMKKKAFWL